MTMLNPLSDERNAKRARRIASARNSGRTGLFLEITAAFISSLLLIGFARLPVGMTMRPMAHFFFLLMCSAVSVLGALPLSIKCLILGFRDRTARWIGFVGFLLSLYGASSFHLFWMIASARHYVLEP